MFKNKNLTIVLHDELYFCFPLIGILADLIYHGQWEIPFPGIKYLFTSNTVFFIQESSQFLQISKNTTVCVVPSGVFTRNLAQVLLAPILKPA